MRPAFAASHTTATESSCGPDPDVPPAETIVPDTGSWVARKAAARRSLGLRRAAHQAAACLSVASGTDATVFMTCEAIW